MAGQAHILWVTIPSAAAGAALGALALGEPSAALASALLAAAGAGGALLLARRTFQPAGAARRRSERGAAETKALPAGFGRYLIDQIPVGMLLIDRRGRVQLMNPMAGRLFGRRPDGVFHISALRAPRFLDAIEGVMNTGAGTEVTFSLARAGAVHLKATIQPLADSEARGDATPALMVTLEDHSQVRRAEELHRDFVANASHELKTPLSSISGIIETLTGHARDDPEATERFLGLMATQTERMKGLVADLLSLNRIELNERIRPETPQSLRRIAWETAKSFETAAAAAEMTIEADPPADLPTVLGDRQELTQLFANLIDNAVKYGAPGSVVEVRARGGPDEPRTGIAVIDRGPGIAREHLPRLTERFYRVSAASSRAKGGTGLGLAIVKHILNRHQGRLEVESTPGRGSVFTVWLPVHERARGEEREAELAESRRA